MGTRKSNQSIKRYIGDKMKEKKDIKYLVKSNNYIGLLFFALVLASLLYILKKEETTFQNIEPTMNEITNLQEQPKEITEITKEI